MSSVIPARNISLRRDTLREPPHARQTAGVDGDPQHEHRAGANPVYAAKEHAFAQGGAQAVPPVQEPPLVVERRQGGGAGRAHSTGSSRASVEMAQIGQCGGERSERVPLRVRGVAAEVEVDEDHLTKKAINIYYEKPDGTPFMASFIAKIGSTAQGTWMAAYPKIRPSLPKLPFNDAASKSHHMVLALRCPTGAPEELRTIQRPSRSISYLSVHVRGGGDLKCKQKEDEQSKTFDVTEWITCGENNAVEDMILLLRLHPTYEVPYSSSKGDSSATTRSPRKRITKVTSADKSSEASDNIADVDMDASQVTGTFSSHCPTKTPMGPRIRQSASESKM
ncbi:hypothetical protein FB451DRAFT_1365268 [Mycena latifolia]|nr:hypothetical protein FB451DRAFT_1365268 [Mycena latifolia]